MKGFISMTMGLCLLTGAAMAHKNGKRPHAHPPRTTTTHVITTPRTVAVRPNQPHDNGLHKGWYKNNNGAGSHTGKKHH